MYALYAVYIQEEGWTAGCRCHGSYREEAKPELSTKALVQVRQLKKKRRAFQIE